MKFKGMILAAALVAPAVFAADTAATKTWHLTGATEANKTAIIEAVKKATGAENVTIDTKTGTLTATGAHIDDAKVATALPTGVSVKK